MIKIIVQPTNWFRLELLHYAEKVPVMVLLFDAMEKIAAQARVPLVLVLHGGWRSPPTPLARLVAVQVGRALIAVLGLQVQLRWDQAKELHRLDPGSLAFGYGWERLGRWPA